MGDPRQAFGEIGGVLRSVDVANVCVAPNDRTNASRASTLQGLHLEILLVVAISPYPFLPARPASLQPQEAAMAIAHC